MKTIFGLEVKRRRLQPFHSNGAGDRFLHQCIDEVTVGLSDDQGVLNPGDVVQFNSERGVVISFESPPEYRHNDPPRHVTFRITEETSR